METPYTGKEAQNQIASWNVGELGNHDGYAEVSSTPVGAESTWEMDENGNVISFSFIIDGVTYTDADYDFTWQKLNYIGASYKENEEDEELKPAFHLDGVLTEKEDPVEQGNMETKEYISRQEAATLAGVTSGTITKWIQMEHFSSAGAGKALRIHRNEFLKWLKEYQEGV